MKKIYLFFTLLLLSIGGFSQTSTYQGNGNWGFNGNPGMGPIGSGTLTINYDGTNLNFTLVTPNSNGVNLGTNVFAMYIDNGKGGGFSSTSGFTDQTPGTKSVADAIAGVYGTNSSPLTFPSSFNPQYGLGISASTSQDNPTTLLVKLVNSGTFTTIASPTLTDTGSVYYKISITPAQIGLSGPNFSFHFMGSLISSDAYRSGEALGMNVGGDQGGAGNIGYNPFTDTTAPFVFNAGNLAVSLGNFTGVAKGNTVDLSWNTKSEVNLAQFNIQKSVDGIKWNTLGNVSAKNIITGSQYSYVDNNATASKNFYRLQSLNKDATFTYSTVLVINKAGGHSIFILGNPVTTGVVNLNISDDNAKTYTLSLYSADGKLLKTQQFNSSTGTSKATINVPSGTKGMCILKATSTETSESFRVMVQ